MAYGRASLFPNISETEGGTISSIIIDGYNLIGISHHDLNKQREKLIGSLIEYSTFKGHDITVVFDGWKAGALNEESFTTGGVKVIYSRLGEKADTVIQRTVGTQKREWIVISSDRNIMDYTWSRGSVPVHSSLFQDILEDTMKIVGGSFDMLEEADYKVRGKGNPRKPSKKEKALKRVLSKL